MDDARSLRVAYVSESYGPHDYRFLAAAKSVASDVWHVRLQPAGTHLEQRPTPVGDSRTTTIRGAGFQERVAALRTALSGIAPDVVHAGPLQRVTFPTVLATDAPVLAVSWGSDLLGTMATDPVWRDVAAFALSRANGFLADCTAVLEVASELGYHGPSARIPWGVDTSLFCPDGPVQRFGPSAAFTVLSTRNWERVYDVQTLAKAFAALDPRTNAHLVLCGSGSRENELRSILKTATAAGQVTWVGRVAQGDLPALYRGADLYVSTSTTDGTSVSLLEAMACETGVLVSDIPGNREWVEAAGRRFPVGDVETLKASLRRLAAGSTAQRDESSCAGRARVLRDADWSKAPAELARLYAEVAG